MREKGAQKTSKGREKRQKKKKKGVREKKVELKHTSKAPNWGSKGHVDVWASIPYWGLHFKTNFYTHFLLSSTTRDIQNGKAHINNDQTLKPLKKLPFLGNLMQI